MRGLDDADEQQREPAEQRRGRGCGPRGGGRPGAGPRICLHVPPAAFDLEELLVAQRDVLGGQVRVGAAQQVLPVQVGLGLDLGLVDAQQPAGGDAQVPVQAGLGGDHPAQLGRASSAVSLSEPAISSLELGDQFARTAASRSAASGLWQITNRSVVADTLTSLTCRLSATCG